MPTVTDILLDAGIPHAGAEHHHGRPGWVQVDCPWCRSTGKYLLGISLTTGAAACWTCGRKNTAAVLAMLTGQTPRAMRDRLDRVVLAPAPVRKTGRLALPAGVCDMQSGHRHYLTGRGFDPDHVARVWGVRGIGQAAALRWRIYIPIYHHGVVVSWTTRAIKKSEHQRYISAPAASEAVNHKDILYGADYARHAVIIHEGPVDVWATGPGAVATFGTAYTESQLSAMSKYPVRVVCYDNEPAAQRRARDLANVLSPYPGTTHNVVLESAKDAGAAHPDELKELRKTFLD